MQQLPLDILPPPAPMFSNFVAGTNAEALMLAQALARGERPARTVMFCGPPGSGKSHLLAAIAADGDHIAPTRWLQPDDLVTFEAPRGPALLLGEAPHAWPQEAQQALFHLLNLLRPRRDVVIAIASPQPPDGLDMREDLRTRLAAGLVIGLQLLSDEDKKRALSSHARSRGLPPCDAVINWLLIHQDRDIRGLMAWLDALDRYALATRRPLTLRLLQDFERNGRHSAGA